METYEKWDIQEVPLRTPFFRKQVETFLEANGLRMEALDAFYALQDADGSILAGAGLQKDILKCVAVSSDARSEGLLVPLVSHVLSAAASRGLYNLKVFTKPEYEPVFGSLGFHTLARAPKAVLMENGRGLEEYCAYLAGLSRPGSCGVIVMNANPFTLGHQFLVKKALEQVQHLFVIPVREDNVFTYEERLEMIHDGVAMFGDRVTVAQGSSYCISAATFPTYFLKELSDASETQMRLDIDLFSRHLLPALNASVRFVGSEPSDALTASYNILLQELLPGRLVEIPRLDGISASNVRDSLGKCRLFPAMSMTPVSSHPYLLAWLAAQALYMELDTPWKPGLVCSKYQGAHKDMDYSLMLGAIDAIRPFFPRMALAGSDGNLRRVALDAEQAMLDATGGVNTHRGAIFALGIALAAAGAALNGQTEPVDFERCLHFGICEIVRAVLDNEPVAVELDLTHGRQAVARYHVKGAREMALGGYKELFGDWLPYYRSLALAVNDSCFARQATLLRIMSTLDDTCVIHRAGYDRAQQVKRDAAALLDDFSQEKLKEMCKRFAAEGISPGGAADMLSLTIFINSITN